MTVTMSRIAPSFIHWSSRRTGLFVSLLKFAPFVCQMLNNPLSRLAVNRDRVKVMALLLHLLNGWITGSSAVRAVSDGGKMAANPGFRLSARDEIYLYVRPLS